MASERERSCDFDPTAAVVKHQHSFSQDSSLSQRVPMWDSSDPDRAPPPLPLPPNSNSPNLARPNNTSAVVAAAAQALAEKARENMAPSPYITNSRATERSPERSLIKGAAHKRMQSLQPSSVHDLKSYIDGNRSPDRSPDRSPERSVISRPATPATAVDLDLSYLSSSPEKPISRSGTPTPTYRDSSRATSRPPPKAILGENPPPSAAMLALREMTARDYETPNSYSMSGAIPRPTTGFEPISTQILGLTTICTNLQREMSQLSRRSKDNATDLVSLKAATNLRDEDIRTSLKDLLTVVHESKAEKAAAAAAAAAPRMASASLKAPGATPVARSISQASAGAQSTPPTKSFSLPHIPSPNLAFDDLLGSPSAFNIEGPASVAMLEKIIREMVTREGQDRLLSSLTTMMNKATEESGETKQKVAELVDFIKEGQNQVLVGRAAVNTNAPPTFNRSQSDMVSGPLTRTTRDLQFGSLRGMPSTNSSSFDSGKSSELPEEVVKLLQRIKDSVAQTGGMVGEVKAQQRDLRGEVMGMGRELARKLDEFHKPASGARAIEDGSGKQDVARIIQEGLVDIKAHLDTVMRDRRRQSTSSVLSRSTSVDSREVYDVVKHELSRRGFEQMTVPVQEQGLDKEQILTAVKEAYETYRPEIDIQQFGLERDEILQCLKEGLEDYRNDAPAQSGLSREEVFECIHEAMQTFQPPAPVNDSHEIREEVLAAVRECLDEIRPSLQVERPLSANRNRDLDVTRDTVLEAVRSALMTHGPQAPRQLEIHTEDLFEAMKAAMESSGSPFGKYGEEVVTRLHGMMQEMHSEFKDYSTANGRDTEQVLDALKDGLEMLRNDLQQHNDQSHDSTRDQIGDNMRDENQRLHDAIASAIDKAAVLTALHTGFESLKAEVANRGLGPDEIDEAMKVELDCLRDAVIKDTALQRDEVMDMMQNGLDSLHTKIEESPVVTSEQVVQIIREELDPIRVSLATSLVASGGGASEDIADLVRENLSDVKDHHTRTSDKAFKAIQQEFEHLRTALSTTIVTSGGSHDSHDEIIEAIHSLRTHHINASVEHQEAIQTGFRDLQGILSSQVVQAGSGGDNEELIESIREAVASLERAATNGGMSEGFLEAIRGEFEVLRANVGRMSSKADSEELLEATRLGLDDLRSHLEKKIDNPERQDKATGIVIDHLNEGLEDLKNDIQKMVNKPVDMTVSYEILDTLKQGLESLREDVTRLKETGLGEVENLSRSVMTGNEIVLADENTAEVAARKAYAGGKKTEVSGLSEALKRNPLEKMELMLAQLQIKVDAMDENMQNPVYPHQSASAPGSPRANADLASVEEMLKDLQATVTIMAARELDNEVLAKKDDTDAIETLLRNTKDAVDELRLPSDATSSSKEQLEAVHGLILGTREAVDEVLSRVDDQSTSNKAETAVLEILLQDLKTAVEDLKDAKLAQSGEDSEHFSKKDLDVLGVLCIEIKDKIADIKMPDSHDLPSKADVEQLTGLIHDFRDSHDKLREGYETDIGITARAFDDRKKEAESIVEAITILKMQLSDVHDELKAKVDVGVIETSSLRDDFKGLESTIGSNFNIMGDVKELMEIVNREFDRVHGTIEDMKASHEQEATSTVEKHDEVRAIIITDIKEKLDDKFDAIMAKYDDAQIAAEVQVRAMEERATEQADILNTTREVAGDLKISLDTLGTTVTAMETTFTDISDKISGDSQTVFTKIDEGFAKIEDVETRAIARDEHEQTRAEVARVLSTLGDMQNESTEFNPKFMVALQEVLALVNQHYAHSQAAQETAQEHARVATEQTRSLTEDFKTALPTLLPALLPAPSVAEERYDDTELHTKLDSLMDHATTAKDSIQQLDRLDAIHAQVLATAAEVSTFVTSQTRLITEGHESREKEAEDLALLIERRAAEKEHLDDDVQLLRSEKESLLAVIDTLRSEKEALVAHKARLAAEVSGLNTAMHVRKEELHDMDAKADALERRILEGIMNQSRALVITRNNTAAATCSPKTPSSIPRATHSSLSQNTPGTATPRAATPSKPSIASQGLSMALKQRPSPLVRRPGAPLSSAQNSTQRRIMSLNQISGNASGAKSLQVQPFYAPPSQISAYSSHVPSQLSTTQSLLKRSQSVRNHENAKRQASWTVDSKSYNLLGNGVDESYDKENEDGGVRDVKSITYHARDSLSSEESSEVSTEQRHSLGGDSEGGSSYASYAESTSTRRRSEGLSTVPESVGTGRESYRSSEADSYMTGDEDEEDTESVLHGSRLRDSFASSTVLSKVDSELESHYDELSEHSEQEQDEDHDATTTLLSNTTHQETTSAGAEEEPIMVAVQDFSQPSNGLGNMYATDHKQIVVYAPPSDSGLGSELPTAGWSGSEMSYFKK